jgi:hypothetical protein
LHAARRLDAAGRNEHTGIILSESAPDPVPSRLADGLMLMTFVAIALRTVVLIYYCLTQL